MERCPKGDVACGEDVISVYAKHVFTEVVAHLPGAFNDLPGAVVDLPGAVANHV